MGMDSTSGDYSMGHKGSEKAIDNLLFCNYYTDGRSNF